MSSLPKVIHYQPFWNWLVQTEKKKLFLGDIQDKIQLWALHIELSSMISVVYNRQSMHIKLIGIHVHVPLD